MYFLRKFGGAYTLLTECTTQKTNEFFSIFERCEKTISKQNDIEPLALELPSKKSLNAHQKAEVTEYLRAKKIPIECDPYGFWTGDNTVKWPILSKIAKRFLSAPCTSTEAERLFSSAGLIINNLRKSLLQENAEMLLFLHHNLVIYNFEYE
uniref:HAT C-terminal dimerisation domain-containing protein n=1 Tax=Meloidogyne enterolobii TaxID=390850 RepID=A0A6V7XF77_MELEN|nr:unnamed protein product [Meloidogyne enterolobii]CAD2197881.1 unnamed protein product [Meloidogyne enterolobii]